MAKQIEREVGNLMVFDEVRPAASFPRPSPHHTGVCATVFNQPLASIKFFFLK